MKKFSYKIKDEAGIHARPAGLLVKTAGKFRSEIKLLCGDKSADAKRLFAVMGMGVKYNSDVTVTAEGTDEELAVSELESFFEENL